MLSPVGLLAASLLCSGVALNNGLALVPPMSYSVWFDGSAYSASGCMNDTLLRATADAMVANGLQAAGYDTFGIDCYWTTGRDANGTWIPDPTIFTEGLPSLLDYLRGAGFKIWMYTDRGTALCSGVNTTGSEGHEAGDAAYFAAAGADFVKEDSCSASADHATAFAQYALFRDALNATGRPIVFNLCGWNSWYAPVGAALGNLWRVSDDALSWHNILLALDTTAPLWQYAGPGGWNDLDMMGGSIWGTISPQQRRAQMTAYALLASPLTISVDVRNISAYDLETYTNPEVIAVNQDALGRQAQRLVGGPLLGGGGGPPLHGPAVVLTACDTAAASNSTAAAAQRWFVNATGENWITTPAFGTAPASIQCLAVDDCGVAPYNGAVITWPCAEGSGMRSGGSGGSRQRRRRRHEQQQQQQQLTEGGCCPDGSSCNLQWSLHPSDGTVRSFLGGGSVCLTATGGAASAVVALPCSAGNASQLWYFNSTDSSLRAGSPQQQQPPALCATAGGAMAANIWGRRLASGAWAFGALNAGAEPASVACDWATCLGPATGWAAEQVVTVRDIWARAWLSNTTAGAGWAPPEQLAPNGGSFAAVLAPTFAN